MNDNQYDGIKATLPLIENKISLMRDGEYENICLPIGTVEWMVKMIKTLHFHTESLMKQEEYDLERKNDLFETIGQLSKQIGVLKQGLDYITGIPHNWEESYSNSYTACIRKAFSTLNEYEKLEKELKDARKS